MARNALAHALVVTCLAGCGAGLFDHGARAPKAGSKPGAQGEVQAWLTTADGAKRLEPVAPLSFQEGGTDRAELLLTIDESESGGRQEIDGFGASLTESAAFVAEAHLGEAERDALWRKLFDREEGIGLSFLRQPMGGSDFSLSFYSYDDASTSSAPALQSFSIARDRRFVVPLLKKARALNPALKLMGSPWSAPAHLKANRKLTHGSALLPGAYQAFADYFVAFVRAYEAEGLPIYAVSPQNEPLYESDYMSMSMTWQEQATFVSDFLGPAFAREKLSTKLLLFDHNWRDVWYPKLLLSRESVRAVTRGVAFHCYEAGSEPEQMDVLSAEHPDLELYVTECTGFRIRGQEEPFGRTLRWIVQKLLIRSLRHGARAVVRWNLLLDEKSGPVASSQQGCKECTGLAMVGFDGSYRFTADYFALGHASKFVTAGARRIDSTTLEAEALESVAFRNPDGTTVLLVLNASASAAQRFRVSAARGEFEAELEPGAVATYVWGP